MTPAAVIAALTYYKYAIIFPLAIIEGPILMVICGFLVKLDYLPFYPAYFVLIAGDFVADVAWYAVGRYAAEKAIKKYGHLLNITKEKLEKIEELFKKRGSAIILVSKITMGFGFALVTLVAAGAMKMNFKKYAFWNMIGEFIWTGILMAVGYSFGSAYERIDTGFRLASLVVAGVVFLAALYGANRAFRKRIMKNGI